MVFICKRNTLHWPVAKSSFWDLPTTPYEPPKAAGFFFGGGGGGGKYLRLFLRIPEQHQSGIYNEIRMVLSDLSYIRLLNVNSRLQKERNFFIGF